MNNGTCTDGVNSFSCTCAPGYTGTTCEVDIDECAGNPCTQPNSECLNLENAHRCVCASGYQGMVAITLLKKSRIYYVNNTTLMKNKFKVVIL